MRARATARIEAIAPKRSEELIQFFKPKRYLSLSRDFYHFYLRMSYFLGAD